MSIEAEPLQLSLETVTLNEWQKPSPLKRSIIGASLIIERNTRRLKMTGKELLSPGSLLVLGGLTTLAAITMLREVNLMTQGPIDWRFALRYMKESVLPSFIWTGPSPDLIALAAGRVPSELLTNTSLDHLLNLPLRLSRPLADLDLSIQGSRYLRWVVEGFWGIGQMMRMTSIGSEVSQRFKNKVLSGRERLFSWDLISKSKHEKVIRFAGKMSDVTEFDLDSYGTHLLSIYENPEIVADLIREYSHDGIVPVIWNVASGKYKEAAEWQGFHFDPRWLIKTKNEKKVLYIEMDSSVGEQALALGPESSNDLEIQEVYQGSEMIEDIARRDGAKIDSVIKVLLIDSTRKNPSADGEYSLTVREDLDDERVIDIVIDAKAPLLQAMKNWLDQVVGDKKTVVFDTTNPIYFRTVNDVLGKLGYTVIDRAEIRNLSNEDRSLYPHLFYHEKTTDTLTRMKNLIKQGKVKPELSCPLLDRKVGLQELTELNNELRNIAKGENKEAKQVIGICSAQIYSNLFKIVRWWIRQGYTPQKIQEVLDESWQPIFDVIGDANDNITTNSNPPPSAEIA